MITPLRYEKNKAALHWFLTWMLASVFDFHNVIQNVKQEIFMILITEFHLIIRVCCIK